MVMIQMLTQFADLRIFLTPPAFGQALRHALVNLKVGAEAHFFGELKIPSSQAMLPALPSINKVGLKSLNSEFKI